MLIIAVLAFLIIFTALILVHEWGHFKAARTFGVKVEEFGLGLPPAAKTLTTDKLGTAYTLNWLPLGGFVRMKGEDAHDAKLLKAKDSFAAKPVWQRMIIVVAGVTMNLISGFVLLAIVFSIGTTYLVPAGELDTILAEKPAAQLVASRPMGLLVSDVLPDSPAAAAGIKKYDFLTSLGGATVDSAEGFQQAVGAKTGEAITLSVTRRNYTFETPITVGLDGKIGVAITGPFVSANVRYAPLAAIGEAGKETVRMTGLIFGALGGMFQSIGQGDVPQDVGGPVAIAKETFYRATDVVALLNFAAMLSITLAVFNILPIPALDGGRFAFLLFEAVTRRRPSPAMEARIHAVGFVFLIGLIVLITFKDIFGS